MKAHKYLQICLQEIEQKLNWGNPSTWVESNFITLNELISKETEISISPHTLKRLYGKIKYKQHYNPQRATKEALVKFLGFTDWNEFTSYCDDKYDVDTENVVKAEKPRLWKSKGLKIGLLASAALLFLLVLTQGTRIKKSSQEKKNDPSFSFSSSDSSGMVPYTISINYDITKLPYDSVFVNFGAVHPVTGPDIKKLDKQRSLFNFTYQIPGYYHMSLSSEGHKLANKNVLATSEDWDSYFYSELKQELWLDNQIRSPRENGALYYSRQSLSQEGYDTNSVYYLDHRIFKNFGIDGDNFEMNLRFKNSKETGGITCYDFVLTLFCKNDYSNFKLMETGCSSYSGLKVGELDLNGMDEDLSSLTFDPKRWNDLYVIVKEQMVQVFVNEELVFSEAYQGTNGNIIGIEQLFKGSGVLDYVHLKDLGTKEEFFDDFHDVEAHQKLDY